MTAPKRHFLFLQGNATPFYRRLGQRLAEAGHHVSRINPGGGDYLFWGSWNAINWRASPEELAAEMPHIIQRLGPTDLILFGDCRPIHRAAIETAKQFGIRINVFEEGYFRPHWITLEQNGVNGYSQLPKDPTWYLETASRLPAPPRPDLIGGGLRQRILYDFAWQTANYALKFMFPGFHTHRPYSIIREYSSWLRRLAKLPRYHKIARRFETALVERRVNYFLFPLQLDTDSQVRIHSSWGRLAPAINHVITSFALHAPLNTHLVIKNHPLDNGLIDYSHLIKTVSAHHGVGPRVHFIDGGDLDILIRHARGIVTINSTAAMPGLQLGVATIALGKAIFDMPGITYQGDLADFWKTEVGENKPDAAVVAAFLRVVHFASQINGNFYTEDGIARALDGGFNRLLARDMLGEIVTGNDMRSLSAVDSNLCQRLPMENSKVI